jgi:sugar lactone lactonase YvrE
VTGSGVTATVDIVGSNTGLSCPNGVVVDSSGNIYVADYGAPAVYVFSAGANGNVAPTQTIPANGTTTLAKPIGIIVH